MPNFIKNTLLFLASCLITLLLAEVAVRLVVPMKSDTLDTFNVNRGEYYRADEELGWLPKPNVTGVHNRPGSFESTFTTNSQGMRDQDYDFQKGSGVSRAIVVGDSFAWGFGVNDGQVFGDALESMMTDWEVINLGVTAFSVKQEALYFEQIGTRFEPDLLLVAYTQNDLMEGASARSFRPGPTEPNPAAGTAESGTFRGVKQLLSDHSAIYNVVTRTINSNPAAAAFAIKIGLKEPLGGLADLDNNVLPALRDYPEVLEDAWSQLRTDLAYLRDAAKRNDVRLIVAMIPALQTVDETALENSLAYTKFEAGEFDLDKPYRRLEALSAELGIEVLNPVDTFRAAHSSGASLYLPGDMHFNAAGHRLFAEEILRYLQSTAPGPAGSPAGETADLRR